MLSISNLKIASVYLIGFVLSGNVIAEEKGDIEKTTDAKTSKEKTVNYLNLSADTSKWKCKYCPSNEDEPWFLDMEAGLGYVTNNSYKFGEYNGLYKEGIFLILDIDGLYRDDNANYFDIKADNLGLEVRRIDIEGGTQGKYKINVLLDNINKYSIDTGRTPYSGTINQTLPSDWVPGTTTRGMATLPIDLKYGDFNTQRQLLNVSGNVIQDEKWNYDIKFKRQTKEGKAPFTTAIGSTFADAKSSVLAKPIDFTTETIELSANYNHKNLAGSFTYSYSMFKNGSASIIWDNAYSTGAINGQIALEPDNEMQQLIANGQYRGYKDIIISTLMSVAILKQNQTFSPYTINAALSPATLPAQSLSGKVETYSANVKMNWSVNKKLKINVIFENQEQANSTNRATYSYVIADNAITNTPRANSPYSFRNQKIRVDTSYRLENNNKITGGIEYALYDRTYQEVNHSGEKTVWAKYAKKLSTDVNYSLKLQGKKRKADDYKVLNELSPVENPQLRKYNLADKDEIGVTFNTNFLVADNLFVSIYFEHSKNDYSNSSVGLIKGEAMSAGIDAQHSLSEEVSLTAYLQQSIVSSTQNGSSVAGEPDWTAENEDSILTFGLGSDYSIIDEELSLGFNFVHAYAIGKISLLGTSTSLPDLSSKRDSVSIYGNYHYNENMIFKLSYDYEKYKEEDWSLDNVTQGTIDHVLNLGDISPNYKIGVFWFNINYIF